MIIKCPKCGMSVVSQMEWNAGSAVMRYRCLRCGELKSPETITAYKTKMFYKPTVSNKTEIRSILE